MIATFLALTLAALVPGTLPRQWRAAGPDCTNAPPFEVHAYNADFVILRQSGCTHFEKPFMFLLFGDSKTLLLDSGAGNIGPKLAREVQAQRVAHAARRGARVLPLVVAHSHAHSDHIAGDRDLEKLPDVTVVPPTVAGVKAFFGATFDLGNRVLDILPIPGHEPSSIAIYDRQTGVLLTGDTLYPGRLFVVDGPAYIASVAKLVDFTASRPVAHILGTHIEQTSTPFIEFPQGESFQPDEHVLELGRAHLLELHEALRPMTSRIVETMLRDFSIVPAASP